MTKTEKPTRRACALSQQESVYDLAAFLVPMLLRGNVYHMGSHAGAWEPGNPPAVRRAGLKLQTCFVH